MNRTDFAYANIKNPMIRTRTTNKRVTPNTYRNTLIGLSQTKKGNLTYMSRGAKIQDGAVYAYKKDFKLPNGNTYKAGIWRRKTTEKTSYLQPLFYFGTIPSVPNKGKLNVHVKELYEKIAGKIWIEEIKKAAK